MMCEKPIAHSYWLVDGRILAGEYPGNQHEETARARIRALLAAGFTCFIDLTEAGELMPYDHVVHEEADIIGVAVIYRRMPIRDARVPSCKADMITILDTLDEAIDRGQRVYLHCWGGVGRTGTIAGCYFARHGFCGQPALDELQRRWMTNPKSASRSSPETKEQRKYVLDWSEDTG